MYQLLTVLQYMTTTTTTTVVVAAVLVVGVIVVHCVSEKNAHTLKRYSSKL